jgi:hypothetical protein
VSKLDTRSDSGGRPQPAAQPVPRAPSPEQVSAVIAAREHTARIMGSQANSRATADPLQRQIDALKYLNELSAQMWHRRELLCMLTMKDRVSHARGLLVALGVTVGDLAAENEAQLRALREQGAR